MAPSSPRRAALSIVFLLATSCAAFRGPAPRLMRLPRRVAPLKAMKATPVARAIHRIDDTTQRCAASRGRVSRAFDRGNDHIL